MKRVILASPAVLILLIIGCASAPSSKYVQLTETATGLTEEVSALLDADVLTPEQAEISLAVLKLVKARLDRYRDAIARGVNTDVLEGIAVDILELLSRVHKIIRKDG